MTAIVVDRVDIGRVVTEVDLDAIVLGVRSSLTAFFTQRTEFKSGL